MLHVTAQPTQRGAHRLLAIEQGEAGSRGEARRGSRCIRLDEARSMRCSIGTEARRGAGEAASGPASAGCWPCSILRSAVTSLVHSRLTLAASRRPYLGPSEEALSGPFRGGPSERPLRLPSPARGGAHPLAPLRHRTRIAQPPMPERNFCVKPPSPTVWACLVTRPDRGVHGAPPPRPRNGSSLSDAPSGTRRPYTSDAPAGHTIATCRRP